MTFTSSTAARSDEAVGRLTRYRLIVFGAAFAVALFMVLVVWRAQTVIAQTNDLYKFAQLGYNIAKGLGLRYTDGPLTIRRAPLYPASIAALYLVFGAKPIVIQIFQCFLAAGTSLLCFEIGRRVFKLHVGFLAAAMVALHPMVLRYVPDIQVECLLTFLYTLTVYRSVRLVEEESLANGFWLGVSAACAAMVKGVALPYPALFLVAYLLYRRFAKSEQNIERRSPLPGWKPMAAMLIAMGLVILPWTYRNYEVTGGRFVLISGNAAGEFLRGYVFAQPRYFLLRDTPYETGENEANQMQTDLFRKQGLVWERDEAETEKVHNVAAKAKLRSDPMAFVRKFVIGFFMFWYVVTTRTNSLFVGGMALIAWVLAGFGWVRNRHSGYHFWLLLLPIASLNLIYAAVLALGRYSAPCIPTLMVLAALGVETIFRKALARFAPSSASV
jgi:4-amino-4-deoxy-L-arabinose transferase-like glycosyltransferase